MAFLLPYAVLVVLVANLGTTLEVVTLDGSCDTGMVLETTGLACYTIIIAAILCYLRTLPFL